MSDLEVRIIDGTLRPGLTFWSMTDGVPVAYHCERIATSARYPGTKLVISGDALFPADDCFSTARECALAARIRANESRAYLRDELARLDAECDRLDAVLANLDQPRQAAKQKSMRRYPSGRLPPG
jgi:hypothetical protein